MIPVECVVRGYLAGSAWAQYSQSGSVAGLNVPQGLQRGERLERPIFTPAVKAPQGSHDENITFGELVDMVGEQTALELRRASLRLYVRAERVAREHGLVLVDTKFEFGRRADGTLVLADEVLTPDSSRFWAADSYAPGTEMPSLDKQLLRDWITNDSGWDPDSGQPAPDLPDEVVTNLSQTYAGTYERLTGTQVLPSAPLDTPEEAEPAAQTPAEFVQPVAEAPAEDVPAPVEDVEPAAETSEVEQWTFIVDVMLREDIPDAQGAAITETLKQLGHEGFSVRQGKRFEVVLDGELTQERVDEVRKAAEELLVNTEVEDFEVSLVHDDFDDDDFDDDFDGDHEHGDHEHEHDDHEHDDHEHDEHRDHDHEHDDYDHVLPADQAGEVPPAEASDAENQGGQGE
jgi:phosphoribosylaminoimidazole-succinocarboxamide synthase